MTTRSAFGTAAIMRRLVISRMRARTLPFTSALPSSSLCSCLSSWWLIFRRCAYRRAAAARRRRRRRPARAGGGRARRRALRRLRRSPPAAAAPARRRTRSTWLGRQNAPIAAEDSASTLAFIASISCRFENTRPRPVSGLSASKFGPSGLKVQVQPPIASRSAIATPSSRAPNGTQRPEQRRRPAEHLRRHRIVAQRLGAVESKRSLRARPSASRRARRERRPARRRRRATAAKWPRSRERATWPFRARLLELARRGGKVLVLGGARGHAANCSDAGGKLERDKGLDWRPIRRAPAQARRRAVHPSRSAVRRWEAPDAPRHRTADDAGSIHHPQEDPHETEPLHRRRSSRRSSRPSPSRRWRKSWSAARRCTRARTSSTTPSTRRTTRRWSPPSRPPTWCRR